LLRGPDRGPDRRGARLLRRHREEPGQQGARQAAHRSRARAGRRSAMTSLTDLRSTLDEHAETVGDTETIARLSAVHHRVAAVRRRRRAVGAAGLADVVAVVGGAALSTRPDRDAQPVGPVVLGQRAPGLMTSLGYTYRATGESE